MAITVKGKLDEIRELLVHTHGLANNGEFPRDTIRTNCDKIEQLLIEVEEQLGLQPTACDLCGGDGKFQDYPESPPECPKCQGSGVLV